VFYYNEFLGGDAMPVISKNVAGQTYTVFAFNRSTLAPVTGDSANITANIRKDRGVAAGTNDTNPDELEDGFYEFNLLKAETNCDVIQLTPESATGSVQVIACPGVCRTAPTDFSDHTNATLVDDIYDETFSGHNVNNSFGKILRQLSETNIAIEGAINDATPTASAFITDLTNADDDFYKDALIVMTSGTQTGQARPISAYNGTTFEITLDEAFTTAPIDTDEFIILVGHTHPITDYVSNGPITTASGVVDSDLKLIDGSAAILANFKASASAIVTGTAITGVLSTTQMTTDLTEDTDDHFKNRVIIWTGGVLANQGADITAYDGTTKQLTYTATTEAPANTDPFVIV